MSCLHPSRACRDAILGLRRELRRLVDRAAADRRVVARRAGFVLGGVVDHRGGRRHDDVAGQRRDVAVVRQEHPVFAGRDEVDADGVLPRIAAGAVLDVQQVAVVLLVALHGHGPRRRGQRVRDAVELVLVGEVLAIGAGGDERFDDLARMAAPLDDLQQLLVRDHLVEQLLELGAGNLDAPRRNPHDARFGRRA